MIFGTVLLFYVWDSRSHTRYSIYWTPQDLQSEARLGRVISDHYSDSSYQLPRPLELCLVVNETCLENLQWYQMNIYYLLWVYFIFWSPSGKWIFISGAGGGGYFFVRGGGGLLRRFIKFIKIINTNSRPLLTESFPGCRNSRRLPSSSDACSRKTENSVR